MTSPSATQAPSRIPVSDGIYAPPTTRLPRITRISETPLQELLSSVSFLRTLYNPEVRGTRRRKPASTASVEHARTNDSKDGIGNLRSDAFEKSYAIRWLTALLARSDTLSAAGDESEDVMKSKLIESAASLLAACAGTASSGRLTRNFKFGSRLSAAESVRELDGSITVQLTDAPLENGDYGTLGAQTWGAACVLAEMIVESPGKFGIPNICDIKERTLQDTAASGSDKRFRALELGAGTGLVGLATAKLLESQYINSEVYLSDFHPSILANLRANSESNFSVSTSLNTTVHVHVVKLDWEDFAKNEGNSSIQELGSFDFILGADIVYETLHAEWLRICVERLLLRTPQSAFHLLIPLRCTHTTESETIKTVFDNCKGIKSLDSRETRKLGIMHEEHFVCDVDDNGSDEVEYVYYRIGWIV